MKQKAITAAVNWINFRKSIGFNSAKRTDIQAAAETGIGFIKEIVFTKNDLALIASQVGGSYQSSTGGKSKIVF